MQLGGDRGSQGKGLGPVGTEKDFLVRQGRHQKFRCRRTRLPHGWVGTGGGRKTSPEQGRGAEPSCRVPWKTKGVEAGPQEAKRAEARKNG